MECVGICKSFTISNEKKTINEENKMNAIAISIASAHFNTLAPLDVNACERKSRYTETGKNFTGKNAKKTY